jgi:hypothetical protein
VVAFRKQTLLSLDDCLYALQETIPHLTRSSLHRCLQRHGISRLPEIAGDKPAKQPFKRHPIGYFHIDIAEVRTEEGKLHLFVAVDRTSLSPNCTRARASAAGFLEASIEAIPYQIYAVLTDTMRASDIGIHLLAPQRSQPINHTRLSGRVRSVAKPILNRPRRNVPHQQRMEGTP